MKQELGLADLRRSLTLRKQESRRRCCADGALTGLALIIVGCSVSQEGWLGDRHGQQRLALLAHQTSPVACVWRIERASLRLAAETVLVSMPIA